jgi:putative membrane protein insertion efficiency factor
LKQFAKFVTLQLLRAYKWAISPMFPPACRYVPTCSEYAMEAVERYGILRGGWMVLRRVLRCHPFARAGYDPVVPRRIEEPMRDGGACAARSAEQGMNGN